MKKKLTVALVIMLALALAVPALAATPAPEQNQEKARPALTPEQSQEIATLHQQMLELRKQLIDKYVAYGCLTVEQGQQIKARLEEKQKFLQENPGCFSLCPFCGGGTGRKKGSGFGPRGMMNGWLKNSTGNPAPGSQA